MNLSRRINLSKPIKVRQRTNLNKQMRVYQRRTNPGKPTRVLRAMRVRQRPHQKARGILEQKARSDQTSHWNEPPPSGLDTIPPRAMSWPKERPTDREGHDRLTARCPGDPWNLPETRLKMEPSAARLWRWSRMTLQAITDAGLGYKQLLLAWIGLELLAQLSHQRPQVARCRARSCPKCL